MNTIDRSDDRQFDRLVAAALRHEADQVAASLPGTEEAFGRLTGRVRGAAPSRPVFLGRPAVVWATLLLLLAIAVAVVGTLLLRELPRAPIIVGPYGPPRSCGMVPVADGDPVHAFRDPAVLIVARSGLVTTLSGDPRDSPPAGEGGTRSRIESRFVTGVLTPAGIALVLDRVEALGLPPGCYRVLAQDGDDSIAANTSEGPIGIGWTGRTLPTFGYLAAAVSPADEAALDALLDSLFDMQVWMPSDAFTPLEPADIDAWIVHTTFRATGFGDGEVIDRGGEVASAGDGRYAGVRLPGGIAVEAFGRPIPGASKDGERVTIGQYGDVRAANQRCGILDRADALILADSLDQVRLPDPDPPGETDPDFYTPDMATAVTMRLHPAVGTHATCEGFAAELNAWVEPSPEPSAEVEGQLATVDPCSLVPGDLRGVVESTEFPFTSPPSPFGVAARSCLLEWRHSMTAGGAERVLWLYPTPLSPENAAELSQWIFGEATERTIDDGTAWLNDCPMGGFTCRAAVAGYARGHYLLLEVDDHDATIEEVLAQLGRILRLIEER